MAKIFVTLTILCIFGAVFVKGFDKKKAIADFMERMEECKVEVGAKDSDTQELLDKKSASSMEGKCLRSCLMKRYEMMDNNGKIVKENVVTDAEKYTDGDENKMKIAHEIIDACVGIEVPEDHCEAAEEYGKCFKKEYLAHGLETEIDF